MRRTEKEILKRRADAETLLAELTALGKPLCAQKGVCKRKTDFCAEKVSASALGNLGQLFPGTLPEMQNHLAAEKHRWREVMQGSSARAGSRASPPSPHPARKVSHPFLSHHLPSPTNSRTHHPVAVNSLLPVLTQASLVARIVCWGERGWLSSWGELLPI